MDREIDKFIDQYGQGNRQNLIDQYGQGNRQNLSTSMDREIDKIELKLIEIIQVKGGYKVVNLN